MEKIGIICEYNPFHNGHLYHLKKIKEMYPDSLVVLAMSGYFTQRGEFSVLSKYDKTRLALKYGVDIVLELPTLFVTNSADLFAMVAVDALNEVGISKIVFGSESNDVETLKKIASKWEDEKTKAKIKESLDQGNSYAKSLTDAIAKNLKSNDILAVSYIKAINKINKKIEPISIQRTNEYNDTKENSPIISGTNILNRFYSGEDITSFIPDYNDIKLNELNKLKLFELLRYRIITEKHLEKYLGVDEGLENKLKKEIIYSNSLEELLDNVISKRYTKSRLKRMLLHILLGIEKDDMNVKNHKYRILGFNANGRDYLRDLYNHNLTFKYENRIRMIEIVSSIVYDKLMHTNTYEEEIKNKPVIY